jgi:hypothetical protein
MLIWFSPLRGQAPEIGGLVAVSLRGRDSIGRFSAGCVGGGSWRLKEEHVLSVHEGWGCAR